MPVQHWLPSDPDRDIAAEAQRPDRAPAVEIRARRALARRLREVAVVIDETIPFPGYEIRRAPPAA